MSDWLEKAIDAGIGLIWISAETPTDLQFLPSGSNIGLAKTGGVLGFEYGSVEEVNHMQVLHAASGTTFVVREATQTLPAFMADSSASLAE